MQLFDRIDGDHFTILGMPLLPLLGALRERGLLAGMIKIALTGSIGMGKSTVARMFERAGVPVFDADADGARLQGPGGALVETIGERFPGHGRGRHARPREARADRARRSRELAALEAIVHPAVQRARERFIAEHRDAPALLFEIPLLFETGGEGAVRQGRRRLRAGRRPARAGA